MYVYVQSLILWLLKKWIFSRKIISAYGCMSMVFQKSCIVQCTQKHVPYSTYYKPMMYYKPTSLSSKFLYRYTMLIYRVYPYISSVCIISRPPVQS